MGKCQISNKNKKFISCRYDLCLMVGMDTMLVWVTLWERSFKQNKRRNIAGKQETECEDKSGGIIDRFDKTINPDIAIIQAIPKASDTLQVANITVPTVIFSGTEIKNKQ